MKSGLKAIVLIVNLLYPFAVLFGLRRLDAPYRVFPLALAFIVILNLLSNIPSFRKGDFKVFLRIAIMALAGTLIIVLILVTENAGLAKLYPVIVNIMLLLFFGLSIFWPPTVIWRLATMKEKDLETSPDRELAEAYCRKVTIVWCVFFIMNSMISLATSLWASDGIWTLYNGLISYILMGMLFGGEILLRRKLRIGS